MASFTTILTVVIFALLYLPSTTLCAPKLQELSLPSRGPQTFAFDIKGGGPYTGVSDGRVLKYQGPKVGFVDYAYTSPNRSKVICDGINDTASGPICGRPFGLGFYYRTGELYIADPFFGLLVVGRKGGLATQLATSAGSIPFRFLDDLEVDQLTGIVYFMDASAVYGLSQIGELISSGDATGRLLKYDPRTRKVTVLLTGLSGPAGVAISKDGTYLLVSEFVSRRIQKYWLKGPRMNKADVLLTLKGNPDNIKRTTRGDFWVAVTISTPIPRALGQKITGSGTILKTITFSPRFNSTPISEVQEFKEALYLGSLGVDYVGVYKT
ncbi:hypothetical protein RJ639_013871 [Escallonia herrerae]|uniref:Strictosidine synthase conserved region domain-containing protein n=1 Tax=Escallonia herrerae TaxID=1293975 RepID=A0AA88S3T7_9ASTE|nr:hypothetical protein RJ639_026074 [Escallonia herrerae]KAK3007721.1 hypothetical protein RJ639_013871 [Escallonia herrerae]